MTQTLTKEARRKLDAIVTPERQIRSDWDTSGAAPRVRSTVTALLKAEDIDQEAANAADRWCRDFMFGYFGYTEYAPHHEVNMITRHDEVSWMVVRANAKTRVTDVRDALGMCVHTRLKMMMVDEKTFSDMGRLFYPGLSDTVGRRKVSAQCAFVLEQLAGYYENQRKKKKNCNPSPQPV